MTNILPLILDNVTVRKSGNFILDGISLNLNINGFTVVMGPNGSGKTTLLRLMHGLEKPGNGSIRWAIPHSETKDKQSFVFQSPIMLRRSVSKNLIYPLKIVGSAKSDSEQLAKSWLNTIGLEDKSSIDALKLSGGEKQKLAIARALITEPQVLFLDEPTTNLDGVSTREIESLLKNAQNLGTRIIMATHDIGQAKRLATDVVFLCKGSVYESESAPIFFENPSTLEAAAYLNGDIIE